MGYTTDFNGAFKFDKPVDEKLKNYVNRFSSTRRMSRDVEKIKEIYPHWKELCFNGELGVQGEYFAPVDDDFGQTYDDSIIHYNMPPQTQPGLWCQWIISDDGKYLEWDEGEKFYHYVEWLQYLIDNFFLPSGYHLSGSVVYQRENSNDVGTIAIDGDWVHYE